METPVSIVLILDGSTDHKNVHQLVVLLQVSKIHQNYHFSLSLPNDMPTQKTSAICLDVREKPCCDILLWPHTYT